ncbi:hypothetical protein [Actinosynnema sp. NPDC020468]|uniref:hypothetical protein n=1 Tax=Actinosynnema sp. NPDC020468 TaxID=3154488 RepID=UPI0033C776C8
MIRLTGAVMAHPRRADAARALIASAPPGFLDLVRDPDPGGPPSGLRTSIAAWSTVPAGSTHHLVLEDDARLAPDFVAHLERAVAKAPDAAIALYTNWNSRAGAAVRLGALAGARWAVPPTEYTPNVALVLPAAVAARFGPFARASGGSWPDDVVLARYLRHAGVRTLLTVPNLVQHGEFPSVSGNDLHGLRQAACFGVPPDDDWSADRIVTPTAVPFVKFGLALGTVRREGGWSTVGAARLDRLLGVPEPPADVLAQAGPTTDGEPGDVARGVSTAEPSALTARSGSDDAPPGAAPPAFLGESAPDVRPADLTRASTPGADQSRRPGPAGGLPGAVALWRNAFALGRLQPDHDEADPLVRSAVASLGPGLLCTSLGAHELRRLEEAWREWAFRALRAGAAAPPVERRQHRISLSGNDSAVRSLVADDLRDRGHDLGGGVEVVVEHDRVRCHDAVLWLGTPYGPGLADGPLPALVLQSLQRHPMRVGGVLATETRWTHVWDVAGAIEHVLDDPTSSGDLAVWHDETPKPQELADLIGSVVRRVEVDLSAVTTRDGDPPRGRRWAWRPELDLGEGIRLLAQWLAYEAG